MNTQLRQCSYNSEIEIIGCTREGGWYVNELAIDWFIRAEETNQLQDRWLSILPHRSYQLLFRAHIIIVCLAILWLTSIKLYSCHWTKFHQDIMQYNKSNNVYKNITSSPNFISIFGEHSSVNTLGTWLYTTGLMLRFNSRLIAL